MPGQQHLKSIGDYAFSKCNQLRFINGNSLSVENVGAYAFAGCSLLSKMSFDGDVISSIKYGAFSGTQLQELEFMFMPVDNEDGYLSLDADKCRDIIISATGFDEDSNPNPLELPEDCVVIVKSKADGVIAGKYDYMMNDMMRADVDINRN